jgi:predicted ferric reductase
MDTTASIYHKNLNVMEVMTETESNMYTHSSLTVLVKGGLFAHLYISECSQQPANHPFTITKKFTM